MKVYFHELSEEPTHLSYDHKEPWVQELLKETEEESIKGKPASGTLEFTLKKSFGVVFVKGKIKAKLGLVCSRCASPFLATVETSYESLFSKEKELSSENTRSGYAYSEPTGAQAQDLELEILRKDYIELTDIAKEQIYLKIPFQPLCKENCKGICAVCGQAQNTKT